MQVLLCRKTAMWLKERDKVILVEGMDLRGGLGDDGQSQCLAKFDRHEV